jgi:hypothetical protein
MVLLFQADFFPRFTTLIEGKVYRESSFLPLKSRKYIDDSLGLYSSINLWEGSFPWFPVNFPHQPIPGWVSHGPIHPCRIWHRHFPAICLGTKMCRFQTPLRMVVDWGPKWRKLKSVLFKIKAGSYPLVLGFWATPFEETLFEVFSVLLSCCRCHQIFRASLFTLVWIWRFGSKYWMSYLWFRLLTSYTHNLVGEVHIFPPFFHHVWPGPKAKPLASSQRWAASGG